MLSQALSSVLDWNFKPLKFDTKQELLQNVDLMGEIYFSNFIQLNCMPCVNLY